MTEAAKRKNRPASLELVSSSANGSSDSVRPSVEIGRNHKLVLLTPDRGRDLRRLNEDYVDRPRYSQLFHDLVAEEATAVVVARLADLPVIENKLLPILGFPGPSRVLLVREPIGWDVTDAEVLVVAHRGAAASTVDFRWLSSTGVLDVISAAELLVPEAKQKLHLFAQRGLSGPADGTRSSARLIGAKTMNNLRHLLGGIVDGTSRDDRVGLLLSAGIDSISTGIACQEAGKEVQAYTYELQGYRSLERERSKPRPPFRLAVARHHRADEQPGCGFQAPCNPVRLQEEGAVRGHAPTAVRDSGDRGARGLDGL